MRISVVICICIVMAFAAQAQNGHTPSPNESIKNSAKYSDDKFGFYVSSYDKAEKERKDLDAAVYEPIAIFSILIGIFYYIFSRTYLQAPTALNLVILVLLGISLVTIILSMGALAFSFNNFFRGFEYRDFPANKVLYKFEDSVENLTEEQYDYRDMREGLLSEYYIPLTDEIREINDKRYYYLYCTRTLIVFTFFTELFSLISFSISSYSSRNKKNPDD